MKITINGKYQTREGDAVEILRDNVRNADFPIVGIITFPNDSQEQNRWMADGKYNGSEGNELDLIPFPTKHEMWFTFDEHFVIEKPCFETFGAARANAVRSGSNVAHVTWEV